MRPENTASIMDICMLRKMVRSMSKRISRRVKSMTKAVSKAQKRLDQSHISSPAGSGQASSPPPPLASLPGAPAVPPFPPVAQSLQSSIHAFDFAFADADRILRQADDRAA